LVTSCQGCLFSALIVVQEIGDSILESVPTEILPPIPEVLIYLIFKPSSIIVLISSGN
jgi:hypothetical protein